MRLFGQGMLAAALLGLMSTSAMADPITPFDFDSGAVNVPIFHPGPGATDPFVATSEIFFPAVPENHKIKDINVEINVTTDWGGDLRFFLMSPEGEIVFLGRPIGPDGVFVATRFDDAGSPGFGAIGDPHTGTFIPGEPLAALNGTPPEGVWTLIVHDWGSWGPGGTIFSWSIDGTYGPNPEPGSMVLCALGAFGLVWHRRRRRNKLTN